MELRQFRPILIFIAIVLALIGLGYAWLGPVRTTSAVLSGLTLAALYFLLGAGLSLIFGLMDVLNFAHGIIFMMGAYIGYSLFGNPRLFTNTLPLLLMLTAGVILGRRWGRPLRAWEARRRLASDLPFWQMILVRISPSMLLAVISIAVALWGVRGFPLRPLVMFEPTATGGAIPTAQAQEPIARMGTRLAFMALAGLLLGPALLTGRQTRERDALWRPLTGALSLAVAAVLLLMARDPIERFMLGLSVDVRFLLALLASATIGALLGILVETVFIRPFHGRPVTQLVLTLGLMFIGAELVKSIWGREGRPPMAMPSLFAQNCRSTNLIAWLSEHCSSVNVLGRAFPTYRLFIILVGVLIFIGVWMLLRYSRMGMIVRAGVQDHAMVEALGINVRRIFTAVFALGSALAALGGVVAAPFVGVYLEMGGVFQLQAFIAVVIGGMGSYTGTAVGALILGLARALGDVLVTSGIPLPWTEQVLQASPAIARASTVLIMAIVLLVRPAGIFGRKE